MDIYGGRSPRDIPIYSAAGAAHYLRIPENTLRAWVYGRPYKTTDGQRRTRPVIVPADVDRRIQRRQLAIDALVNAGVRVFGQTVADMTGREQAAAFVRALPRMARLATASSAALIGRVGASGRISLLRITRR